MKRQLLLVLLIILCHLLEAQKLRQYKTLDYMATITKESPFDKSSSQFERDLNQSLKFIDHDDYTIPVVFHILYSNDEEKISKSRIANQLKILNEDFSLETPGFTRESEAEKIKKRVQNYYDAAGDVRVRFCTPSWDPENHFTDGIVYFPSSQEIWKDYNTMKEQKQGSLPWDPERYLNIWICRLDDDNSGYAQMPFGPSKWDGIVIDYRYFGTGEDVKAPYDEGHTLTHLVGNYLGLYPLWGPYPCGDDYVDDTPIHNAPNHRCPDDTHYSLCEGNPVEMTMNFMDNTYDVCLSMFTKGQRNRIQKVLHEKGPRGKLPFTPTLCSEWIVYDPETNWIVEEEGEFNSPAVLSVRPNPADQRIWVSYIPSELDKPADSFILQIFSVNGHMVLSERTGGGVLNKQLDVSRWSPGLYIMRLSDGSTIHTHRFIVQE
ncbi:MAG TPA: zinc-dependent metalloprotease [Saprospiraceae bacterium]|nr:zinc-dependent metalloprotease [Saprospiraceae bacterium]